MSNATQHLVCDGCGQLASPEHIAKRLRRLEWTTRFRPVHINTVLLAAAAPERDEDFFYSPEGTFAGEAALLAEATGLSPLDRPKEQLQAAFQRAGFFAAHVLECAVEGTSSRGLTELLAERLPAAITRIRRSLRPKRVVLISPRLDPFVAQLTARLPGCRIVTDGGKAFSLGHGPATDHALQRLRSALALASGAA